MRGEPMTWRLFVGTWEVLIRVRLGIPDRLMKAKAEQ
jgi:hypothetical protein